MAQETRRLALTTLLVTLALAAFAIAAVTITNVTEWRVYASYPPIVKEAGSDAGKTVYGITPLSVSRETGSDGINRTIITIYGFKGDLTTYDEVIRICNRDGSNSYNVYLVYNGTLYGSFGTNSVWYLKLWLGATGPLTINSGTALGAQIGPVTLNSGACIPVRAEVLVDANAPTGQLLVKIAVNVQATGPLTSP